MDLQQPSFTSGELSPSLYGRVDLERYFTGLAICRNFIVMKYGGVQNRPGTKFISEVNDSTHLARLIPFQFSDTQTYVLEFGNYTMRAFRNGVLVTPTPVVTLWADTDLFLLKFTQSNDVVTVCHPDYPVQQISRYSDSSWTVTPFNNINGPFLDLNVNQGNTVYASASTGTVTLTANFALFDSTHLGQLIYLGQNPDSTTPAWQVQTATAVNDIVRAGSNYYQAQTAGTTGTVEPDVLEGVVNDGTPGITWAYLHSGSGIALIAGVTDSMHATATVLTFLPELLVSSVVAKSIAGLVPSPDGVQPVVVNILAHYFLTGASVTIAGVTGTTGVNGTSTITVIDANHFSLNGSTDTRAYTGGGTATNNAAATPTYNWAFEAWGSTEGYPCTTGFYQQRQCFGGMAGHPSTIEMSRTAGYTDFGVSNPIVDDDALTVEVFANKNVQIRHILELSYLVVLTSGGIWAMFGGSNGDGVVTPSTVQLKSQSINSVSNVPPLRVDHVALFVQDKGAQVRSLMYSYVDNNFIGQDVTLSAGHLFAGYTLVDWCYQETPNSIIWAVRSDGALLGFTFVPDQQITAWHRHDTPGNVESCICITENNEDVVYLLVNRTISGVQRRYIERMDTRDWSNPVTAPNPSLAWFVDCGQSYSGAPATVISGLDYLDGQTVSILADGFVHPQQVVIGGSITLNWAASNVVVGLPITADLQTLELTTKQDGGMLQKNKIVSRVSLLLNETLSVNYGPDAAHLLSHKQRTIENYNEPINPLSGIMTDSLLTNWGKTAQIFIRQSDPLPITILAIMPEVTSGGN
jgi:hypothetical protein